MKKAQGFLELMINKVSDKKLCSNKHDPYKHYVFYEHNNKLIPLKVFLMDVTGSYYSFSDDNKTMNFIFKGALFEKCCEIFSDIETKLGLQINDFTYYNGYATYFRTKVTDETGFRQNNDTEESILPRQKTNYNCRILVKTASVFFNNNKDNKNDIIYYAQVLLEECRYTTMINRRLLLDNFDLSDNDPDSESESEEEFNENTA